MRKIEGFVTDAISVHERIRKRKLHNAALTPDQKNGKRLRCG